MRFRAGAATLALAAGLLWPVAGAPGTACADEGPRAALVVDTGESVARYCVALTEKSVSGIELIALAGEQHGLEYHLGFGGAAVCMLAGVGPTGDDCFEQYPEFWAYWRGDGAGGWAWSGAGASSTVVEDGDIEGWSWGAGDGPDSHQPLPPTEFDAVCKSAAPGPAEPNPAEPNPAEPKPDDDGPAETDSEPPSGAAADASDVASERGGSRGNQESGRGAKKHGPRSEEPATADPPIQPGAPSPSPPARAAPASEPASARLPAGGVAALVASAGLVVAGAMIARRRRTR